MNKRLSFIVAAPLALATALGAHASTITSTSYGGVTFPQGDVSFADVVFDHALGDGVGGTYDDPNDVLGAPDWNSSAQTGSFSLGVPTETPDNLADDLFGFVTVQFTDNSLTTSGNSDGDLFIFEIGGAVEKFRVEISKDGINWTTVAEDLGQPVVAIDIDAAINLARGTTAVSGEQFSFVRVSDVPGGQFSSGPTFAGPDIDAIGAITSGAPVPMSPVPLPAAGWMLLFGVGGLVAMKRRKKA